MRQPKAWRTPGGGVTGAVTRALTRALSLPSAVAAAVAVVYLLRATFTGANQTLANGNTLGEGGTYPDYAEDGLFTVHKSEAAAVVEISGNALRLRRVLPVSVGDWKPAVSSSGFSRAAGLVCKFAIRSLYGATENSGAAGLGSAVGEGSANKFCCTIYGAPGQWIAYCGVDGALMSTNGPAVVNDTSVEVACVLGGFTGTEPDVAGTAGNRLFYYDGSNWRLTTVAAYAADATMYFNLIAEETGTTAARTIVDNIKLPNADTTVEAVFAPTGYAHDTFTDTNGVLLEDHTADAGFGAWTSLAGEFEVNGNALRQKTAGATAVYIADSGLSDAFIEMNYTTGGLTRHYEDLYYRKVDANNHWNFRYNYSGSTDQLYLAEYTGGSATRRAGATISNPAASTNYTLAVRVEGTKHECWLNGTNKLSYTSATHQSGTILGMVTLYDGVNYPQDSIKWIRALPLTSPTYDAELGAI